MDLTTRLLIPIIVLQNHNRYNILQAGHNKSIDIQAIEREVSNFFLCKLFLAYSLVGLSFVLIASYICITKWSLMELRESK